MALIILPGCGGVNFEDIAVSDSDIDYITAIAATLSDGGPRVAGSIEERAAGDLVMDELGKIGVKAAREEYSFQTFMTDSIILMIDGHKVRPYFSGINPFGDQGIKEAQFEIFKPGEYNDGDKSSTILLAEDSNIFFYALQKGYMAFFAVDKEQLITAGSTAIGMAEVSVYGRVSDLQGANIVATIGKKGESSKEIWLSAHYDSYPGSPGANDNGTGLGALLAMAHHLKECEKSLPYNYRLIFPGSEENGITGSRIYARRHREETGRCRALINFDTFGGNEAPYIAAEPGVSGVALQDENLYAPVISGRSLEDPEGRWRMCHPPLLEMVMVSNYPELLQQDVADAASTLGIDIYTKQLMSDHLVFARAGIPSISIQSRQHSIHSVHDTPANINHESVEKCFALALELLKVSAAR